MAAAVVKTLLRRGVRSFASSARSPLVDVNGPALLSPSAAELLSQNGGEEAPVVVASSSSPNNNVTTTTTTSSMILKRVEHLPQIPAYEAAPAAAVESAMRKSSRQASDAQLWAWLTGACGLRDEVAGEYWPQLKADGFDSPAAIAMLSVDDLERRRVRTGHARTLLARVDELETGDDDDEFSSANGSSSKNAALARGGARLFDYETIKSMMSVEDVIPPVEHAFKQLAAGKVDVPIPMHIGVDETEFYGPGDVHVKGGYVSGTPTFTVKLACVSFYKNLQKDPPLPPGAGIFVVMSAETGQTLAVMQENRYLTDLRTGAAGALAVKYLTRPEDKTVAFLGCGAIARNMARAAKAVKPDFHGVAFAPDDSADAFAADMADELGLPFEAVATAHEACRRADIIFTQTPGSTTVLEKRWLRTHATIIASGSDQPTKQELPVDVIAGSKYVADLVKQTSRVGELRPALAANAMTEADVYAELGDVVSGVKPGRVGDELIVVDLTGTGAQDAAVGEAAWMKLKDL